MKSLVTKFALLMTVAVLLAPISAPAATGVADGTGPVHDILAGTPFSYTGEIATVKTKQDGFTLALADGSTVDIFGLSPEWYWESLGYDRPVVGDTVTVDGFAVDYSGVTRNIAMSITISVLNEEGNPVLTQVMLRDPETGLPLWKSAKQKIKRAQKRAGNCWCNSQE